MALRPLASLRRSWEPGHTTVVLPLGLIAVVFVVDTLSPSHIHLGPLLVAAPALTVAFAGARLTALVGALAVATQVAIGVARGVLATANIQAQIGALLVVSALLVGFCLVRDRREQKLHQVTSVAEAAQQVLLRPLPSRSGPLEIAHLYLPAEEEAEMGGDLYAAARTSHSTRLLIADVRGKGLAAISHAALLLGAFRAAAHRQATLRNLAVHLDGAMRWDSAQWRNREEPDTEESFATAMLLDIPDEEPVVRFITCGHPPALRLGGSGVSVLPARVGQLPLGLARLAGPPEYETETFPFERGELLLLYTDGVVEARDADGAFYPLTERAAAWRRHRPEEVVRQLRENLIAHVDGHLGDDAAAVAVRRI
ncbi:serine/threonine-protein phosphatase [Streptomyces sp. NA02950]|uniref:PP2C family protein-serine/threonine phosphatase n=1 Tax=Streptomyces sp. NA02950 TaxID=2742137 RepID=UPI001592045D|nr:PP2C family protein-serine/threonine phosphatase [Streptomyces sp. NA02950]QKV96473.1 serine/threonine-protein phosphatase [Streptomyces sp. NA02950]